MALYGQIAVVFLLLLAYLYYQRLKTHRALSALPQPKNWNPIFGNLQVLARHIALQDTKAGERHLSGLHPISNAYFN